MIEAPITKAIQVTLSKLGARIFRNNTGGFKNPKTGQWVKYGLCEGSADLVGWNTVIVTSEMVGKPMAVFVAVEVKAPGARTDPVRLAMQTCFINAVQRAGGIAGFATSEAEAIRILGGK